jgi:anti-anti-sigma factor
MSFHFCSHSWEVRDTADGTIVSLSNRDLSRETVPLLVDELFGLVQESGRPNLYLDFANVGLVPSLAIGKLVALSAQLQEHGGRLELRNVNSTLEESLQAMELADFFNVQQTGAAQAR